MKLHRYACCLLLCPLPPTAIGAGPTEFSASTWRLCAPPPTWVQQLQPGVVDTLARQQRPLEVSAAELDGELEQQARFSGDVTLQRADQRLQAPTLDYDQPQRRVLASGGVYYGAADIELRAERLELELEQDRGTVTGAEYWLPRRHGLGSAATIHLRDAEHTDYEQVRYTTCTPDAQSWHLTAATLQLDETTQIGVARDTTLHLFGAPVLYLPYFSFPLSSQRKSGFLLPDIASTESTGLDVSLPYYWNLAPNYDLTLTPRLMSDRGALLGLEGRYLLPTQQGLAQLEYLPQDSEREQARSRISLRQGGAWTAGLRSEVVLDYASDRDYFRDLGNAPEVVSTQHLEQRADVVLQGGPWTLLGRVQSFQTLDPDISRSNRPYRRLPQLLGNYRQPDLGGFDLGMQAEYVYFDHPDNLTGSRMDLLPSVSFLGWQKPWGYATPKLSYRLTRYDLDERGGHPLSNTQPERQLPLASLDAGLWFERPSTWFGHAVTQTLEPRLYYLYVPQQDQDDLPNFDSAALDFSFAQLFRENRFSGNDRWADANQLTLALTSRWLADTDGAELARVSAGRILYFEDRTVTLPGQLPEAESASAWVTELGTRWGKGWSARATVQWDSEAQNAEQSVLQLHYQPDRRRILNLAYRLREDELEQTDVSWSWQVDARWQVIGRWNYALDEGRSLETLGGFEYESCCWILRAFASRYVADGETEPSHTLGLQLELKGLTSFGQSFNERLQQRILGYGTEDYAF